jgi:L,D-transpeptidase ErfK/SrfK
LTTHAAALALGATLAGCVAYDATGQPIRPADPRIPVLTTRAPAPAVPGFAARDFVDSALPAAKIGAFLTRVPLAHELPPLAGTVQLHTVTAGEDLLTIARAMGIGFRALRDANPGIDEWEPKPGTQLVVPTRWIMPRGTHAGLVINVAELRLFMFPTATYPGQDVTVLTWPIGAGDQLWQTPIAPFTVTTKDTNPTWVVPDSIYRTMQPKQRVVPPGPDNPLGAHRIRLSLDTYLLHGTNDPWTVGRLTTHGCVRLYPEDVAYLYTLVDRGTPGEFVYQPVKLGALGDRLFVEVHTDIYQQHPDLEAHALAEVARAGLSERIDRERLAEAVRGHLGIPIEITRGATTPALTTATR